jgi:hypothetical protein
MIDASHDLPIARQAAVLGIIPTGADDDSLSVTRGIPKSAKV